MALNDIVFQKQNGGMGRPAANEDVISGLIMSLNGKMATAPVNLVAVTVGTGTEKIYVAKLSYFEQLASQYLLTETEPSSGTLTDAQYATNAIVYHVREFFRMSPTGKLYLAIKLSGDVTKADIKQLQYYAGGSIRQMGIFTEKLTNIADYQVACTGTSGIETGLEQEHQPLSLIVTLNKGSLTLSSFTTNTTTNYVVKDRSNVSLLISCDLDENVTAQLGSNFAYYGCIGNALGAISKAAVHESIAWVQKFPAGLKNPGFITGVLLKEVSMTDLNLINDNRYIFVRTHVGDAGNYYNDSHTLDVDTSDYAYIENVRTMDKATRGIRTNILPYLNAPLYVDASTGKLRSDTVAFLETTAGRALEDMEKAGELSGYKVEIDPEQNVLATSELEIQIKQVNVGVMRKVVVKIGYTTSIN